MKRKLLAFFGVLLVALTLAACHSSEQYKTSTGIPIHWQQNRADTQRRQIELMVPAEFASDGMFMRAANHAVTQANRTSYINMVLDSPSVIPTTCDAGWHCIVVTRKPMNGGVAYIGWDANGHMNGLRRIEFDSAPWQEEMLLNAFCHEVFHQLGLAHSSDGTKGPCQTNATDHDISLVNDSHGHSDPVATITSAESAKQPAFTKVVAHDRAYYEKLMHNSKD